MRRRHLHLLCQPADKMDRPKDRLDILYEKYTILSEAGDKIAEVSHFKQRGDSDSLFAA